ncbi:hypothetical protein ACFWUW_26855 [Streptomyces sp. NPDC058655]|uniref:hypothetical protein n=1 Tax=Streptomyces sp. NPDC058655 TaxID=3346577 RepID=UPI00365061D4
MKPHHFPADLLALQQTREQTYIALAHAPTGAGTAALRRALVLLDLRLSGQPKSSVCLSASSAAGQ